MSNLSNAPIGHIREVGGQLVEQETIQTSTARVEILRRKSSGQISWQFRQPTLTLLWFKRGVRSMQLKIGGIWQASEVNTDIAFTLVPPSMEVQGEFRVDIFCEYAVAFFDPLLIAKRIRHKFNRPLVGFRHDDMLRGFAGLCREAPNADNISNLYSDGWAMQTIGQLARIAGTEEPGSARGTLTKAAIERVRDYIAHDVSRPFRTAELATIAGLSPRHFLRAFQESFGQTPHRFILDLRVSKARHLLSSSQLSATAISLECGFSHSQHLSTSFRRATGMSPREYRNFS